MTVTLHVRITAIVPEFTDVERLAINNLKTDFIVLNGAEVMTVAGTVVEYETVAAESE